MQPAPRNSRRSQPGGTAPIRLQVMWNRLISVVQEQAMTLLRTAFSTTVREAGDLSAGVFDENGLMLAQAVTGTPGHVNTMAEAVGNFLRALGRQNIREGDCYLTNDPWKGTGHLHDVTMVSPSFHRGKLVGFFACTAHVVDIGGRGFGPDALSIFEEGLYIPIMRFADRGAVNQDLVRIVRANVREPEQVVGDLHSLASCNEVGHRRLVGLLEETGAADLNELGAFILKRSREATLQKLAELPRGRFQNEMTLDGYDQSLRFVVTLTLDRSGVHADFSGSPPVSAHGINVPIIYTKAYSCFGLKCALAPEIPNNAASLEPFTVTAPEGCILNAPHPAPVAARHVIGQMLPDIVLGALAKALPDQIPAEGASALWVLQMQLQKHATRAPEHNRRHAQERPPSQIAGQGRSVLTFNSGGTGARPSSDGLSATAFPSGVQTTPVEAAEHAGPVVFWRKELRPDSGGAGRPRGGLGQIMEIAPRPGYDLAFLAMFDRVRNPPRGRRGGRTGAAGLVRLSDGTELRSKGRQPVPQGKRLVLELPGGGGFGNPKERSEDDLRRDLETEIITPGQVRALYGREPRDLKGGKNNKPRENTR